MTNPLQTSAQYDDFSGRIAIDEYRDAGHSTDLLRFASQAAKVPKGFSPVGITFAGPPAETGDKIRISVVAVSNEFVDSSIQAAIAAKTELPCEEFEATISFAELLQHMKRIRVSLFPKQFSDGKFTGLG